jgi:SP family sugar:H+ symporter-like MFS transporter
MGGFIFGYDTGQISGFLAMQVFKENFGELQSDGSYYFSDVRSGLIVALVSDFTTDYAIKRLTIL